MRDDNGNSSLLAWTLKLACVIAVVIFAWKICSNWFLGEESTTHINVTEGRVAVYKIEADGTPNYIKTLRSGDNIEISGKVKSSSSISDPVQPMFSKAVKNFLRKVDSRNMDRSNTGALDKFIYFYSESAFTDEVLRPLISSPLTSIELTIRKSELEIKALIKMMGGITPILATGTLGPDPRNQRLRLKLSGVKINGVQAPAFMLRQLEGSFVQAQKDIIYPLRIVSVDCATGGIIVTTQRITAENERERSA